MNLPDSSTPAIFSFSSSRSGAYCALTSVSGIATGATLPFGRALESPTARSASHQPDHRVDDQRGHERPDDVVRVAELLVEALPARADRHTDTGECEAPDGPAERGRDGGAAAAEP